MENGYSYFPQKNQCNCGPLSRAHGSEVRLDGKAFGITLAGAGGSRTKEGEVVSPMLVPEFRCDGQSPWEQDHPSSCPWIFSRLGLKCMGEAGSVFLAFFRA